MNISPLKIQTPTIKKIKNTNFTSNSISSTDSNSQKQKTNTKTSDFIKKALVLLGVVLNALGNLIKNLQTHISNYTTQNEQKETTSQNDKINTPENSTKTFEEKTIENDPINETIDEFNEDTIEQPLVEKNKEENVTEQTTSPTEENTTENVNETPTEEAIKEATTEKAVTDEIIDEMTSDKTSTEEAAADEIIDETTTTPIEENIEDATLEKNDTTSKTKFTREKSDTINTFKEIIIKKDEEEPENQKYIQASKILKQEAIDLFNMFDKKLSKSATLSKNPIKRAILSGKDDLEFDFSPFHDNGFAAYETDSAKYKISFTNEGILDITKTSKKEKVSYRYHNNRLKECTISQNEDGNCLEKGSYNFNYMTNDGSLVVKKFNKPIAL